MTKKRIDIRQVTEQIGLGGDSWERMRSDMGMGYEINVSKKGRHFFATAERSIMTEQDFIDALEVFRAKFPASEGYRLSGSVWSRVGEILDLENYKN